MKRIYHVALMTVAFATAMAQTPFTAREGLEAAMQYAGVTDPPSALGVGNGLREQGRAILWIYAFRKEGAVVGVGVQQEMSGNFVPFPLMNVDTSALPILVNADPLPADFIDSDSAMALIESNSVYQEWMAQHTKDPTTERFLAGRLRQPYPMPAYTPMWIYSVTAPDGINRLTCWCAVDGTAHGCETSLVEGTQRFSVQEALEFSQQTAGTTDQPCLVGAQGADTTGRAPAWYYVFPVADSVVAVFTQGLAEGIYRATTVPLEDTTGNDMPFYFRASAFARGWLNSSTALEQMRQTTRFREWVNAFQYDSTATMLIGGRLRTNEPAPQGTAVWIFGTQAVGVPDARLYCWCNLETVGQTFVDCAAEIISVPPSQQDIPHVVLTPNPASEGVIVRFSDDRTIQRVVIYDLQGRVRVVPSLLHGSTAWLDVSGLTVGSYSVVVEAKGGLSRQLLHVMR